jgi:hypothetical protein
MATKHDDDDKDDARKKAAAEPKPTAAATAATTDVFGRTAEQRELMASNSIGAQIILDYNGDGSLGARGGAGGTIEENTMIRDAHLVAVGLDPTNPSGPPTGEPWVPPEPPASTRHSVSGHATRMSSLAAGIIAEPDDVPPPPAGSVAGAASR